MQQRILIVEDDKYGRDITSRLLSHSGMIVDLAEDAIAAGTFLDSTDYTAVLIDLSLPGKNGWDLLADIRSNPHTRLLPCFAITAFHSAQVEATAKQAGFAGYFQKPIDVRTFVQDIQKHLA